VDVRDGELVVVDLDMLLELAVLVPVLDFDDILQRCLVREEARVGVLEEPLTPKTRPSWTRAGSFLTRPLSSLPARRPHSMRAFWSTARSTALKGTRLARRMVSRREVAVTMWEEPAVREVKMYRAGSVEKVVVDMVMVGGSDLTSDLVGMLVCAWDRAARARLGAG
jgi:hypothetical protein